MSTRQIDLEMDTLYAPRRRERFAYAVAGAGVLVGVLGFAGAVAILPLKEIEAHIVVVDQATGEMDRIAHVEDLTLDESEAIIQALLVSYVDDRETYDRADSQERITGVLARSDGAARASLIALWTSTNPDYPIAVYGDDQTIDVTVTSVTPINASVSQVRFTKTLTRRRDRQSVTRGYIATVGFEFRPGERRRLEDVWANPLAFTVTTYRVDAETLEPRR
ncbi:MAG: type IV secretion system protein [Pseudomonadota bacterium]